MQRDSKMRNVIVRDLRASDEKQWRELWDDYCGFYKMSLTAGITDGLWQRILDNQQAISTIVAEDEDATICGFANYLLHEHTWGADPICYLEDLFTKAEVRGKGFGRALIDELAKRGRNEGWDHVYWMTEENNTTARRLYDRYTKADGYVRYVLKTK